MDYSYEDKMLDTLISAQDSSASQVAKYSSLSPKKNLNDLLANTCTSHLGNPIDSFVPSSSTTITTNANEHSSGNSGSIFNGVSSSLSKISKSRSNKCVTNTSSSTTTRTSSIISSNGENIDVEVEEICLEQAVQPPPPTKYRQANVAKLINKKMTLENQVRNAVSSTTSRTCLINNAPSTLQDVDSSTYVKSNFIRPKIKDIEPKHETSV